MELFDPRLPDRFWDKVMPEPNSGCWLWTGSLNEKGYGQFSWEGKPVKAHIMTTGPVPNGMERDHKCRIRSCCNDAHLEIVTHAENMKRTSLYTQKEFCAKGHPLSGENLYVDKNKRQCKACAKERSLRNYYKRQEGYKAPGF